VKVLGIIPARAGASRFPGKPLAVLRGRPLVAHVWERARACSALDRVVIATDDAAIAAAATAFGAEAVMTRADHESGTDRCAEVAARPEFAAFGAIANVQGDEPLLDPAALAAAVAPVARGEAPLSTLAHVETDAQALASPHVVQVLVDAAGDARDFVRGAMPGAAPPFLRHVGLYVFARDTLAKFAALPPSPRERAARLEQLRALAHGIRIRVVITPFASRGVDTPADLAALERDWDTLAGAVRSPDAAPREAPR
jgi:3-deoxy-manno-octulosonate cytidylyltransferase (CMP-KDO synthetase)